MHRALYALPLLAATVALAQTPIQPPAKASAFKLNHVYSLNRPPDILLKPQSCPVGMAAEQQATGATQWVVSLEDNQNPSRIPPGKMGVHVALNTPKDWNVHTARVQVAYQISPAGALLVDGNQTNATKTFDIAASEDPTPYLERSLVVGSGASISRVNLISLTYANGTEWQPAANNNCSVRISHLLRVASR